jgi:hypothetical protein
MSTLTLIQSILVGGTATALGTQLLKNNLIPVPAQKYPRITAFIVSLIASVVAVMQSGFSASTVHDWTDWLAVVSGTLLISSVTYNHLLKGATVSDVPQTK